MKGCEHTNIVIMAGGIGSRLWPVSTPEMPKQFIDLLGVGKSLLQLTVERFRLVADIAGMWVVTTHEDYLVNVGCIELGIAHSILAGYETCLDEIVSELLEFCASESLNQVLGHTAYRHDIRQVDLGRGRA